MENTPEAITRLLLKVLQCDCTYSIKSAKIEDGKLTAVLKNGVVLQIAFVALHVPE